MAKECEGCKVYSSKLSKCSIFIIPNISETQSCPCISCLIKGICDDMCEDFRKYARSSNNIKNKVNEESNGNRM